MRRTRLAARLAVLALLLAVLAHADDGNFEFSKTANPSGPWSYGWSALPGGAFQAFTTETNFANGLSRWSAANGASLSLACNGAANEPGVSMLPGQLSARVGAGGAATMLRWTPTNSGTWHARATFVSEAGYFPPPVLTFLNGAQASARFGAAVAVGDVNGDGVADVVVGQPMYTNGQLNEGRVLLYLGGPSGPSTTPAWTWESDTTSALFGTSIGMGDFNGDGRMDFVVGAPGTGTTIGSVRLFLGTASTPVLAFRNSGFAGDHRGSSCCMGDFNGDGKADIAVVDPTNGVLVWLGTAGPFTSTNTSRLPVGFKVVFLAVATAGDANGDGYDDLLVGQNLGSTGDYSTALYEGGSAGLPDTTIPVWTTSGDQLNDGYGTALASAGDVNHDGYDDFLVGAPAFGSGNGRVKLFLGGPGTLSTTPAQVLDGSGAERLGSSLCPMGDLNGDGYADFAIGAANHTNTQSQQGVANVYHGGPGGTATFAVAYEMSGAGAHLGSALAMGDVDGDLTPDLVSGAPDYQATTTGGRVMARMDVATLPPPLQATTVRVRAGGIVIAQDSLNSVTGRDTITLEASVGLAAGQPLDVEMSDAGGKLAFDAVAVDVSVEPELPSVNVYGPVLELAAQRFVPIQGPPAFEAAAFDPRARRFASNGHLYDTCGNAVSTGPDGPGIAWDLVSGKFWNISFDAGTQSWVVSSWDTTNHTATALFAIPRVLTVPGTGPDTLEDARGLAVDSTSVYVVDAGPANLNPPANAWFKLTRTGTPIASRKGAAFAANATLDIVDDAVYAPFASPTAPGRVLVAIEHRGILAFDTNGVLRDSCLWRSQGLARSDAPSAFAGLALDPASGDLFLADNDRGLAQRWVRLTDAGPTSYLVTDGPTACLAYPTSECTDRPQLLWNAMPPRTTYCPPSPFVFGMAYRAADQWTYSIDYATGTLWKLDPRSGRATRVGETGVNSVWGLAWDSGRDRFYGAQNVSGGTQMWSIHPRTAVASALPQVSAYSMNDIAFEPNGGLIYGLGFGAPGSRLVRIDRDTGVGTTVGPTANVRGLDFDPVRGALLGLTSGDSLYSINPGTGAASPLALLPGAPGWEGIAVVPVGASPTTAVEPSAQLANPMLALAVAPQPSHEQASLRFALSEATRARLEIYDVAGRLVRRLADARFTPGAHALTWDGRDASGGTAGAGVYFARLVAGDRSITARLVRIR